MPENVASATASSSAPPTCSPLEHVHHLLLSLLRWWPYRPHERSPSLLLCGPPSNGKSHLVRRVAADLADAAPAAEDAVVEGDVPQAQHSSSPAAAPVHVVTVTPALARAVVVQNAADGSTGLRRLLRRDIQDACLATGAAAAAAAAAPADRDTAVLLVLDHLECFLAHDEAVVHDTRESASASASAASAGRDGAAGGGFDSGRISTLYPALVADLYALLQSRPPLFTAVECAALRLRRIVVVGLFTGDLDAVLPVVRHRYVDFALSLPTPTEAERRAFFAQHTAAAATRHAPGLPPLLADALALRSGGVSYGGLCEVVQRALDDADDDGGAWPRCLARDSDAAGAAAQRILHAYQASGSVTALEYRRSAGFVDVQTTRWDDIAGMAEVKAALQRLVTDPLRHRDAYARFGVRPSTGVLLHGPPGTGKTMLAKAMATELNASFIYLDLPELVQSELGESERRLQAYFDVARERSPSLVFMDEVQAAFGVRYAAAGEGAGASSHDARLVSHLLRLLDAAQQDADHFVLFVGATNVVHLLDPLLLRAGRLDTLLEVPLPDAAARESLVRRVVLGEWASCFAAGDAGAAGEAEPLARLDAARAALVAAFVQLSEGFSGAELRNVTSVFALQLAQNAGRRLAARQAGEGSVRDGVATSATTEDSGAAGTRAQHHRDLRRAITAFLLHGTASDAAAGDRLSSDARALLDAAFRKVRA